MMKNILVAIAASAMALTALTAQAADAEMLRKHKLGYAACHVNGTDKPVSAEQCRGCHPAEKFEQNYELKNGNANPHVPLHYDPTSIDCTLCHRNHRKSVNYCEACHADGLGFKVP